MHLFPSYIRADNALKTAALGESSLRLVKKGNYVLSPHICTADRGSADPFCSGEVIQLNRRGFFICDQPYVNADKPLTLIFIPDGHSAHASTLSRKVDLK